LKIGHHRGEGTAVQGTAAVMVSCSDCDSWW
jgi:hypothetical protein